MIGYYIHHHGRGHLARAMAIASALSEPVTGLSSLPRPDSWGGGWLRLPLDVAEPAVDPDANGRLHWAPLRSAGLEARMAAVSAWIERTSPAAIVVDVSVEVALLARLHGIPVVVVALAGGRTDASHALGYDIAAAIVGAWPPAARGMLDGLSGPAAGRLQEVGAISALRFMEGTPEPRSILVLGGAGGDDLTRDAVEAARQATPGWTWRHVGGDSGTWVEDPGPLLREAAVVVTHAGQGALADVAAACRPAIVLPQARPYDEQRRTAAVLADSVWPAIVLPSLPAPSEWSALLGAAETLDGGLWRTWNDGGGAGRAAAVIRRVAGSVGA